jgi:hypothetical protein
VLGATERSVVVSDHVGLDYHAEPVSFDLDLATPAPAATIGLRERWSQVEILAGTPAAVTRARIWTTVDFPRVDGKAAPGKDRHLVLTLVAGGEPQGPPARSDIVAIPAEPVGGVETVVLANPRVRVRVPATSRTFDPPVSALTIPGPVISIGQGGGALVGRGYLDCINRVAAVEVAVTDGPVYREHGLTYRFSDGKTYQARVRLYAAKPYAQLVEDFDLGGNARYVLAYDDFPADGFFRPGDSRLGGWESITAGNPCGDFVEIHGQRALARLVIWSQFNYFGGKQETVALKTADPAGLAGQHAAAVARFEKELAKWEASQEEWKTRPPKKGIPPRPERPAAPVFAPATVTVDNVTMPTTTPCTPGGDGTAVGAFLVRPDRWTRAKVNHVDLYLRPEVPGDPMSRGEVGLAGAVLRPALEAWLVEGHREWAIFAVRAGDERWLAKAHVQEGIWPLDRLNRLPLVWNSDGSPVAPADAMPGDTSVDGAAAAVLLGTGGRSGLQYFNGSNPHIRGGSPKAWDGKVVETRAGPTVNPGLVGLALNAYFASDDSAYPSRRAMLPWSDPEAINPFYQGMENMNFNADLYRSILAAGIELARRGHPDAERFIRHAEESFDLALGRYVYPQSGCWEESHGYAGHTVHTVTPLVHALRDRGRRDFFQDPRFARMISFFCKVYSPVDAGFGVRVVPPIGDHGLSKDSPTQRLGKLMEPFAATTDPAAKRLIAETAGLVAESGGRIPAGIEPVAPDRSSAWLQGYGAVLRGFVAPPDRLRVRCLGALVAKDTGADLLLELAGDGKHLDRGTSTAPAFNTGSHRLTVKPPASNAAPDLDVEVVIADDKWVKGGTATLTLTMADGGGGRYTGTFLGQPVAGELTWTGAASESFVVLRAGQSWGHHHEDKGSLWFWGRNVPFCGDCAWGGPPGGTYGNPFKQGPASGTQLEFRGITNWTLPCKYPAPWIADSEFGPGMDYALARCLYPFNPAIDLSRSTPVALANGYDRQVLFVHPDLLLVRDHVETNCPVVWRLHAYQPTTVAGARATLDSPYDISADLVIVHPAPEVVLTASDAFPALHPYTGKPSPYAGEKFGTTMLSWPVPPDTSPTWILASRAANAAPAAAERLDPAGRVVRVVLGDGTVVTGLLDAEPFTYQGDGWTFTGTVGAIIERDGKTERRAIRGEFR